MSQELKKSTVIRLGICCAVVSAMYSRHADGAPGSYTPKQPPTAARILFLHHSTGECVWNGGVKARFDAYNKANKTHYGITEQNFPKSDPYGWNNYPYDYWNIWVRHAGHKPYMDEPTLEMLTPKYDVIVFKHCFPVSSIEADTGKGDAASEEKRIENYKLQYSEIKKKLHSFPKTKFIVWTGAALVKGETDEASARRAKEFFNWVRDKWDQRGDNIYLWDFQTLETGSELYLKDSYAAGDSHPNEAFSKMVAPLLCNRILDVIRGDGDKKSITGRGDRKTVGVQPVKPPPPRSKPAAPKGPQPVRPGLEEWVFDNAEDPEREMQIWGKATYAKHADGHLIRIQFAQGREEDWGEYGHQRIVTTTPPAKNHDIARYRYLGFRVRADRDMELVVTLVTRPDSLPRTDESYFGFTAYLHLKAGSWQWTVLDLEALELNAEGEKAYAAAGKPTRPEHLTCLKFVTNKKNENANLAIDDISFHRVLPKSLAGRVQQP